MRPQILELESSADHTALFPDITRQLYPPGKLYTIRKLSLWSSDLGSCLSIFCGLFMFLLSPKLHQIFQFNTLAVWSRSEKLLMLQMSFLFICYKIICHIHSIKKFLLSSITHRSFLAELMPHKLFPDL